MCRYQLNASSTLNKPAAARTRLLTSLKSPALPSYAVSTGIYLRNFTRTSNSSFKTGVTVQLNSTSNQPIKLYALFCYRDASQSNNPSIGLYTTNDDKVMTPVDGSIVPMPDFGDYSPYGPGSDSLDQPFELTLVISQMQSMLIFIDGVQMLSWTLGDPLPNLDYFATGGIWSDVANVQFNHFMFCCEPTINLQYLDGTNQRLQMTDAVDGKLSCTVDYERESQNENEVAVTSPTIWVPSSFDSEVLDLQQRWRCKRETKLSGSMVSLLNGYPTAGLKYYPYFSGQFDDQTMRVDGSSGLALTWQNNGSSYGVQAFQSSQSVQNDPDERILSMGTGGVYTVDQQQGGTTLTKQSLNLYNTEIPSYYQSTGGYSGLGVASQLNVTSYQRGTNNGSFEVAELVYSDVRGQTMARAQLNASNKVTSSTIGNRQLLTAYNLDALGRVVSQYYPKAFRYPASTPFCPVLQSTTSHVKQFTYMTDGKLSMNNDSDSGTTMYKYDRLNRLRFQQDAIGATQNYCVYQKYDSQNRVIERGIVSGFAGLDPDDQSFPTVSASPCVQATYVFDCVYQHPSIQPMSLGQLVQATSSSGPSVVSNMYDVNSCIASQTQQITPMNSTLPISSTVSMKYSADKQVRVVTTSIVTSIVTSEGTRTFRLDYSYNSQGRLQKIKSNNNSITLVEYDYSNSLAITSMLGQHEESNYPALQGQMKTSEAGVLQSVVWSSPMNGNASLLAEQLNWTAPTMPNEISNQRLYGVTQSFPSSFPPGSSVGAPASFTHSYTYDGFDRLTKVVYQSGSSSFTDRSILFDEKNNPTQISGNGMAAQSISYGNTNNHIEDGSVSYDAKGRITKDMLGSKPGLKNISYDPVTDRTTSFLSPSGFACTNLYDALNRKVYSERSDGTTFYLYDPLHENRVTAEVFYKTGTKKGHIRWYVYGLTGLVAFVEQPAASSSPTNFFYVASDHQNSSRLVVDEKGSVQAMYAFLPFGEMMTNNVYPSNYCQDNLPNVVNSGRPLRQLFTGAEYELSTGYYDFKA